MDEQTLEQVKQLFQQAYKIMYEDGKFDTMANRVEESGDVVAPVSQLASAIITSVIKDAGVKDVMVVWAFALMLISDMLSTLQDLGTPAPDDAMPKIVSTVVQQVLSSNPKFAELVSQTPEAQEMLQSMKAQGGHAKKGGPQMPQQQQPPQGAPQQAPVAQGVMASMQGGA